MSRSIISQITLFPYEFAPQGWAVCDGSTLPISENEALFQILGTTFGGNGETTFGLPNLTPITPKDCHYCIALFGEFRTNHYDGIVGETLPWTAQQPLPGNMLECKGGTFTKGKWYLLQQYLGNRFGGDGVNTFGLPDLTGVFPAEKYRYVLTSDGEDPHFLRNRNPFVGEIILLPYSSEELETLKICDGRMFSIEGHPALFALLGKRFGGNDKQFAIPDLRRLARPNYSYYLSLGGVFPSRP